MGHDPILPTPATLRGIQHFPAFQFVKDWEVNFHIVGNWENLMWEVIQGLGYAVSDGSYKPQQGAAAWIIEGSSSANWVMGKCFAPSTDNDHSFFLSKLASIYTCLLFIYYCFQHSLLHKPSFYQACDGKSVLHRLWNPGATSPGKPHYDLLSGTCRLMLECRFTIQLSRVKGHQDNGVITALTHDATLNIEANLLAKDKLARYVTGPTIYNLPFAYGTCYVSNCRVVKNLQSVLRNHINGFPAVKYWQQHCKILPLIWARINWQACQ